MISLFAKLSLLFALTISIASADSLTVVNPNFANVSVQCGHGYAYQSYQVGDCSIDEQNFNSSVAAGWASVPFAGDSKAGDGVTDPNTNFRSATSNVLGTAAAVTFVIPSNASVGANTVIAIGQRSGAVATSQITVG